MTRLRQNGIIILASTVTLLLLALTARPGLSTHVNPQYIDYNAKCSDLAPDGVEWDELKVGPVEDGSYSQGSLTVTLDVEQGDDADVMAWSANMGVDGVFVKGGPGGHFYHYGSNATSDTGLIAPFNENNGKPYKPGHMLFCTLNRLPTASVTATPSSSATSLPPPPPAENTLTPTPSSSATLTPTPSSSATASPTASGTATGTPSLTPSASPSGTPSGTSSTTPSATSTPPTVTAELPTATGTLPPLTARVFAPLLCRDCSIPPGEPNNTCPISYGLQPDTIYEFYADDVHDWYWFRLEEPAELQIRLENFMPLDGQLAAYYGSDCKDAALLKNYGNPTLEKALSLGQRPAGLYFIYVSNDGDLNSSDPYRLIIATE